MSVEEIGKFSSAVRTAGCSCPRVRSSPLASLLCDSHSGDMRCPLATDSIPKAMGCAIVVPVGPDNVAVPVDAGERRAVERVGLGRPVGLIDRGVLALVPQEPMVHPAVGVATDHISLLVDPGDIGTERARVGI